MSEPLPDDADGDALRRLVADGSDLSRAMKIDFAVDVPHGQAARAFAESAERHGFRVTVSQKRRRVAALELLLLKDVDSAICRHHRDSSAAR
jgi:hypothetical protein